MAASATPHFQNSMGLASIEVGAKEFMCIGALPPFDHPHVFIDMGAASETICPYCSTLYKFNKALAAGDAKPAEAVWHDGKAAA
ncbi:MAG: zinc-finger domain-containing protein [Alphaproteobacteria bacterium]|nr:zinc-finger domain-containing protein [Alphaproteobacteria bacterium]